MKQIEIGQTIGLKKATNGYLLCHVNQYGNTSGETITTDFIDAIIQMAEACGETQFVGTLRESAAVSQSLEAFFGKVIAPKLTAIEAKINPGIENVVSSEEVKW